jgi:ribose 5-phosphate isomerase A
MARDHLRQRNEASVDDPREALKRQAAERAVEMVRDGMVVGLGTGSTARYAVEALAARVQGGLDILGIPTSEATAGLARRLGLRLTGFAEHPRIDLAIDGADEVERGSLALIKGHGGALLREKIVAAASDRVVIIVDDSKLVVQLGRGAVPVEVVGFGWEATQRRLETLGAAATLRRAPDGAAIVTDGGNVLFDCAFGPIADPADCARRIKAIAGVIESGLFVGFADRVIVAGAAGIVTLGS